MSLTRHTLQSAWAKNYAREQREWHRSQRDPRKVNDAELDAYCIGVEQGFSKAIAMLCTHGLIREDRVSGVRE